MAFHPWRLDQMFPQSAQSPSRLHSPCLSCRDGDTFPSTGGDRELGGQGSALMGPSGSLLLCPGSCWGTEARIGLALSW